MEGGPAGQPASLEETILDDFASDSDAFFDQLMTDAGLSKSGKVEASHAVAPSAQATSAEAVAPTKPSASQIEAEYAQLEKNVRPEPSGGAMAPAPGASSSGGVSGVAMFDMDGGDSSGDEAGGAECDVVDYRPPPIPDAPPDFTAEDNRLRDVLVEFYLSRRADNLSNVNLIVKKYRGANVPQLWVMLATKYKMPAVEVVEYLGRTLYLSAPFEYEKEEQIAVLEQALYELREDGVTDRAEQLKKAFKRGAGNGSDDAIRVLAFRGIPDESGLRPQVWKVLLGYTPLDRQTEWNAIQSEKRASYGKFRSEFLVSDDHKVHAKECKNLAESQEAQELLHEIENDVNRTRRDLEYFNRPATRSTLLAMLFVYARLNPGVRYVQGMNEVAAVLLYVMSGDPEFAEADAFWCFNELMVEIKEGFMQALDHSHEGIHAKADTVQWLLFRYDPDLAKHLQKQELSLFVFVLRWCTVLFAQDATLPDAIRLWDAMLADPRRFEFCLHLCASSILAHREQLLESEKQITLAEILQSAPRSCEFESQVRRACAICAFERRPQNPPFPPRAALGIDEISEKVKGSLSRAQVVIGSGGAEAAKHIQENIAPVVQEKAAAAAAVAAEKAQVAHQAAAKWMEDTAPARKEALEKAQTHFSSFWGALREKTSELATKAPAGLAQFQQTPRAGGGGDEGPPPLLVATPEPAEGGTAEAQS